MMNFCDYDKLVHYVSGSFSSKYKTVLEGKLRETTKDDLPDEIVSSFKDCEYKTFITLSDLVFYRIYGKLSRDDNNENKNGARKLGNFVSTEFSESLIDSKIRLALDPSWLNTRMYEAKILLPKGNKISVGIVAPVKLKTGTILDGGADQIILPQNWSEEYVVGYRFVTTHQLINPPTYTMSEPEEKVSKNNLYRIPACPNCSGSNVVMLAANNKIVVTGSNGGRYQMKYKCNNAQCNYYW